MELLRGQSGVPQAPASPPRPAWDVPSWWENMLPGTEDRPPVSLTPETYDIPANIKDPETMLRLQDYMRFRTPVEKI